MRHQHLKLKKRYSTKAERIFAERLKSLRVKFRTKNLINNREIDFIVNNYAIDINGSHIQDGSKNKMLVEAGYIPVHISNQNVKLLNLSFLTK